MRKTTLIIGLAFALAGHATATDVETLRATYDKELETITRTHGERVNVLFQQYTNALAALLADVKTAGDLGKTLAVKNEVERFRVVRQVPDEFAELAEIRKIQMSFAAKARELVADKARKVVDLSQHYSSALLRLQRSLVSSDKLDKATAVEAERIRVASSKLLASAKLTVAAEAKRSGSHPADRHGQKKTPPKWRDLKKIQPKSATGGRWFKDNFLSNKPRSIAGRKCEASEFIMAHARARIEYEFLTPIREFRATIVVDTHDARGNVIFKVETNEGIVYNSNPVTKEKLQDVELSFKPTRKLVLVTDQNGSDRHDHSLWLHPKIR